jgi:hypothetical protein
MKKEDPIDVEVTHVEENDELVELAPADIDTGTIPEDQVPGTTPQRRHAMPRLKNAVMSRQAEAQIPRTMTPRVDLDQVDYDEDFDVLRILYGKIFRKAIVAGVQLPDMPDVEAQVQDIHGDLSEAFNDLDDARDGKTDVDWQLSEWKEALAR